ncbi:hypothetical protein AALA52_07435, partial [Lactococcus ileimucosae]
SYLLDAAEMTAAIEDKVFNGFYYYGIHVESGLVSPDQHEEFLNDGEQHHAELADLLQGIQNGVMFDDGPNPLPNEDSAPAAFDFSTMRPGRIFTMAGEQYRYLENMGSGNHMIIRNEAIRFVSWNAQNGALVTWFDGLSSEVKTMVRPVSFPEADQLPDVADEKMVWDPAYGVRWLPSNFNETEFGAAVNDLTTIASSGSGQAFSLSLADVIRLSGPGKGFPNHMGRVGAKDTWWWMRTSGVDNRGWNMHYGSVAGRLTGGRLKGSSNDSGGLRPALIINQPN